jgi:exopolysaccharide biosynthesis polyprenyl glycosylphosphotransferase
MIRRHGSLFRGLLMAVEGATAIAIILVALEYTLARGTPELVLAYPIGLVAAAGSLLWVAILYLNGAYRLRAHWTVSGEVRTIARSTFWLAWAGLAIVLVGGVDAAGRGALLALLPALAGVTIVVRLVLRGAFAALRGRGHNVRNLVILGTGQPAVDFAALVRDHSMLGVSVVGYLGEVPAGDESAGVPAGLYLGGFEDLPRVLRERVVDEVAVCVEPSDWPLVDEYVRLSHAEGKLVRVPLSVPRMDMSRRILEDLDGVAVLSFTSGPDQLASHAFKRAFDLAVGSALVVLLSPVLLGVALMLRITQGPVVMFRQTRVGMHGRPFTIQKFRTMSLDAEERFEELASRSHTNGAAFKMVDDPRVTPLGRWLRRYSLDELPQLFNVLRGDMSIVGPRPAPPREVALYDLWHRRRLSMKPGITGLWQITQRFDRDFDERAALDLRYIDRWSLRLDMAILFRTLPAIFRRPGH